MSGVNNPIDPFARFERHIVMFQQDPFTTALLIVGTGDTATVVGTASLLDDATGEYINYASGAVSGNQGGVRSTAFTNMAGNQNPIWSTIMKTGNAAGDITNMRLWAGIVSADPQAADAPGAIQLAAFRYAPATDGTAFWRTVTSDGSAATTTATAQAITNDARYVLRIDWSVLGQVDFYINDIIVASHTTNLPAAATTLGWVTKITTTAAAAKNIRWHRAAFEQD